MSESAAYRKLSHREHVLMRPNVYVGSVAPEPVSTWLLDETSGTMQRREDVQYVPALLKVFDEIVVNSIDHATRTRQRQLQQPSLAVQIVKRIDISIDRESGIITVSNDGDSIPVEVHAEMGVYVPEMIFGHLLTSTNYDDDSSDRDGCGSMRTIGGQNGIGAKACNILSIWFEIEVVDSVRRLKYSQRFEDHMATTRHPAVAKSSARRSSLTVRFLPDYSRLGMPDGRLSDDMYAMMVKRVYDATAVTDADVAISLDGRKLEIRSFERYVDLYVGSRTATQRAYERPCDGWEVAAALSDGSGMQQVSFVNGVATLRGGRHVDHIVGQMCRRLCDMIAQRAHRGGKGGAMHSPPKMQYVRDNLLIFVRATVPGAVFDSQSKEALTTPASRFGAKVELSDAFIDKMYRIDGLVERVVGLSGVAAEREARKTDGSKRATVNVPKLEDADWAGTAKSDQCTLILTEGDSAKASAVAGLAVVGRQRYGVFPLRGKVMNVCDLGADKVTANAEIAAIKKILGLQTGRVYRSTAELRYGRVMLMTDADSDGSHIKGLVMNLFLQLWPSLLRLDGFMCSMLTPIVKVTGFGGRDKAPIEFYNMGDFDAWKAGASSTGQSRWTSKYYKGLGTSTPEEAREWFRRMRIVAYTWEEPPGSMEGGGSYGESSRESLLKAFDKRRADDRKVWLQNYDAGRTLDYGRGDVTFTEFVERDLVHFSNYDVLRSIPSAIDGLKVSQRKAMFGCRKRNLVTGEVRVAQLAAYISEQACFHHGEASMQGTIVGMAQDFMGSGNNLPLLEPIGQFGTRLAGGSDWASPRYIHTRLSRASMLLFPKADDAVLDHLDDDGIKVEPRYYLPIIPLVLVNGASGIGTGYSTTVPSHCPLEVISAVRVRIRARLAGDDAVGSRNDTGLQLPWHRGFRGTIERDGAGKVRSKGVVVRDGPTRIRIDELPVGMWTDDFKATVDAFVERVAEVRSAANESTDSIARFVVTFATAAAAEAWIAPSAKDPTITRIENELRMTTTKGMSSSNMHLFNANGQIRKYDSVSDIIDDFFEARLDGYVRRRMHIIKRLSHDVEVLRNRVLFVEAILDGRLHLNVDPAELEKVIAELGISSMPSENDDDQGGGYAYLLAMPIATMTRAKKNTMDTQLASRRSELAEAEASSPFDAWTHDLDTLEYYINTLYSGV